MMHYILKSLLDDEETHGSYVTGVREAAKPFFDAMNHADNSNTERMDRHFKGEACAFITLAYNYVDHKNKYKPVAAFLAGFPLKETVAALREMGLLSPEFDTRGESFIPAEAC